MKSKLAIYMVDKKYQERFVKCLINSFVKIRRNALREFKEAAYDLDCNAVIDVDFDYLMIDQRIANFSGGITYQSYVFGVTTNGNAVIIEKIED